MSRNRSQTCPRCDWTQAPYHTQCERCSAPLSPPDEAAPPPPVSSSVIIEEDTWRDGLKARLFHIPETVDVVEFGGRCLLLLLLTYMGLWAISMPIEDGALAASKMHLIHLVFHEAGHIILGLFGRFLGTAGGTLMQLIMPAIIFTTFVFKYRNSFGGAVALWWIGHSCLDIAPYAYDARSQKLILLGGVTGRDVPGYHDWNTMLSQLQWLEHDHTIAAFFYNSGALLVIAAIAWGGYLLGRQYPRLEKPPI